MNAPDRLPPDVPEFAEMEARLRAGMRRAPLPESVALRLATAKPGRPSRRGVWLSRIVSAATVALCIGLVWHFTSKPARVAPGGDDEKSPPKQELDEDDNGRVVQRYDLKDLLAQARSNKDVMRSLFPERAEPALGLVQPAAPEPSDAAVLERAARIAKDMLGAPAEIELDQSKGELTVKATRATQGEVVRLLKVLRGSFEGENHLVNVELLTYELDEKQFAKLLPDAKADGSMGFRPLPAKELEALLQASGKLKVNVQMAPRVTTFPGQGATMSVTKQHSYIADYDINGTVYDPVIKSFLTGFRFTIRAWPSADAQKISIRLHQEYARHVSTKVRQIDSFTIQEEVENAVVIPQSLPVEFPVIVKQALEVPTVTIEKDGSAALFTRRKVPNKEDRIVLTIVSAKTADFETDLFKDEPNNKDGTEKTYDVPDLDKIKFIDVPKQK